jgi:Uncharacterized protein conserved in bacteria (DUF2330)
MRRPNRPAPNEEAAMLRRLLTLSALSLGLTLLGSASAFACGGLVAPGHAEALQRATTLSAWHGGFEHYVTGFQFIGSADRFGYIIPLPGVPSKIEKAGEWTLERLLREINPVPEFAALAAGARTSKDVQVLQRVTVDALDIVVVKGGGRDVAAWAGRNGFDLTPDTPQVMQRYSSAGAIFALAKFDNKEAIKRGVSEGQGTIIHFTIPTKAPWIPLQILALGKNRTELVDADLFILTDDAPSLSLAGGEAKLPGLTVRSFGKAGSPLLQDLRSDRGMGWLPRSGMWLTALTIHTPAGFIRGDLSIDGGGPTAPSQPFVAPDGATWSIWLASVVALVGVALVWMLWRPARPPVSPA